MTYIFVKQTIKRGSEQKLLIFISGEKLNLLSFCFLPRVRYALVFLTYLVKVNTLHLWSLCRNGINNSVLFNTKVLGRYAPNFNIRYWCPLSVIIVTMKGEKKLAMLWWFKGFPYCFIRKIGFPQLKPLIILGLGY